MITRISMCALLLCFAATSRGESLLVEAESFDSHGGWKLDTQFIDEMGSPYLLAHGLGDAVDDASTTVISPDIFRNFVAP